MLLRLLAMVGVCMFGSCASRRVRGRLPSRRQTPPESGIRLSRYWWRSPIAPALDIAVELFDPGISDDDRSPLAAVRRMESQLLAGELRERWSAAINGEWCGWCPRRLADAGIDPAAIVVSDGRDLVLAVS